MTDNLKCSVCEEEIIEPSLTEIVAGRHFPECPDN
jgi:hypothetical protein